MCNGLNNSQLSASEPDLPVPPPSDPMSFAESDCIGHPLLTPKPRNVFRLYMQNPNGISIGDTGNLPRILDALKQAQVDLYMSPESKLNAMDPHVSNAVHSCCRKAHKKHFRVALACSGIALPGSCKQGGVLSVLTGNNCGRVSAVGSDEFG